MKVEAAANLSASSSLESQAALLATSNSSIQDASLTDEITIASAITEIVGDVSHREDAGKLLFATASEGSSTPMDASINYQQIFTIEDGHSNQVYS